MTGKSLDGTGLKRLHRGWRRQTEGRLGLLLDSVQTPYNVGSILRTAAAYRVDHLWLAGSTESPGHAKTKKTALGSDRYVTWTVAAEPAEAIAQINDQGFRLVGVELAEGATPIHEANLGGDVCLAGGHEDRGLSSTVLDRAETVVYIPQLGKIGSLNVATATAIAIYEMRRQAWV